MSPIPVETNTDLKKYSVNYVVNQCGSGGSTSETSKSSSTTTSTTSPKLINILNSNGEGNTAKKLITKTLLFPRPTDLIDKSNSTIVLGKPSNERSYILTNNITDSKIPSIPKNLIIHTSTENSESGSNTSSVLNKSEELNVQPISIPQVALDNQKLKPLQIPVSRHTMDHGRSIVNSKSYDSIHSMHSARRELNNNLFSTSTPSSLPSIGRTNSVFVNPVRNDENYYYPITKIQLPPAGDANEGYYIKAVGYQPSHDFGYNSMSGTRYNSIDSNSSDFEIGNRLRQLGKIQEPQEDPRQQYINVPYRVGDMATQSSYASSYPGGKYQRSTTNGYISGPTASVYRPNSNISIPVPHMYPEAVTNNSNTGPAYDKIIRSINNEYTPNNPQYPQPIYQFNPTITNPQQQQQQQQQQLVQYPVQEHYHYQLGTDNQDVPHYGKIPSHFHKKKINQCNICGKILTRPSSLHSHMFVHTGDRPYICKWPNCGKTFNVKSNMNRHYKLHLKRQVIDDKLGIKRNEGDKLITENKPYILSHNEVGR